MAGIWMSVVVMQRPRSAMLRLSRSMERQSLREREECGSRSELKCETRARDLRQSCKSSNDDFDVEGNGEV